MAMSFWIFALLLMAVVGAAGFWQGAIRAGFSFFGILLGALLAGPLAGLFKALLPWFGIKNPVILWAIAPVFGFWAVNAAVKYGAFQLHRKVDIHYKHKTSELEQSLWLRLNSRMGLCVGLFNGAAYLVLISFLIYNLSYWTSQMANGANQPLPVRMVNQLGADLQATGFNRAAAAVGSPGENFYQFADLAGFMIQNPQAETRLESYPGLTSLFRKPEMQPFFTDADFTNTVATGGSATAIWNSGPVQQFFASKDLMDQVSHTFAGCFTDLTNFLMTGNSPKYDAEKLPGSWKVNVPVTVAWLIQERGHLAAKDIRAIHGWYDQSYAATTLLATGDGDVYVKAFPIQRKDQNPNRPVTTDLLDLQGRWTHNETNYDIQWKIDNDDKFYSGTATETRLTLKDGRNVLVFDRQ